MRTLWMTTLWKHYENTMTLSMRKLWKHYGNTMRTLWEHYENTQSLDTMRAVLVSPRTTPVQRSVLTVSECLMRLYVSTLTVLSCLNSTVQYSTVQYNTSVPEAGQKVPSTRVAGHRHHRLVSTHLLNVRHCKPLNRTKFVTNLNFEFSPWESVRQQETVEWCLVSALDDQLRRPRAHRLLTSEVDVVGGSSAEVDAVVVLPHHVQQLPGGSHQKWKD